MSKPSRSYTAAMLLSGLMSSSLAAQTSAGKVTFVRISAYEDDPFVDRSTIDRLIGLKFTRGGDRRLLLNGSEASIQEEAFIFRLDPKDNQFKAFANNPWPAPAANSKDSFEFPDEERFPLHEVERDAQGNIVLRDGLQVWKARDLHLGMTTAFESAEAQRGAAEAWSGRAVTWGNGGTIVINAHAFIDFNAFYSPSARQVFFGVVPYRLPGETAIKMLELATSWEMGGHEFGHAVHHELKPNVDLSDTGFRTWGESFGDQTEMWTSLRDPQRALGLLAATKGDLKQSSALSRIGEAFGVLAGQNTGGGEVGLRDAFNDKKVSDTSDEVHDRSEVLTGAAYHLFLAIYGDLTNGHEGEEVLALRRAANIMGNFLTRATDYTPENQVTLEEVGQAYLKVDKEFLQGHYQPVVVDELTRRGIFDASSVANWNAHEAAIPKLKLASGASAQDVVAYVLGQLQALGIGPALGLAVQSVTRDGHLGQTIVRVQLTQGRGAGATPLANHGILVFRADGTLADYHSPVPPSTGGSSLALRAQASNAQASALIGQATSLGLDRLGAPLALVRSRDGKLVVEARVLKGPALDPHVIVYTAEHPQGERREVVSPPPRTDGIRREIDQLLR